MPWEQSETEIKHRLKDPGMFDNDSFRSKDIGNGISLIIAKRPGESSTETQAIRFDKEKWSLEKAKKWIIDHRKDFHKDYSLHCIHGVEVFSCGTWNGDKYTEQDLDEMIRAFEANKDKIKPYLKLGHDDKQELLQKDGYPAAGWIARLYRVGEKLCADFVDIPSKIYELIKNKAYRKVSSEIYWNIELNGNKFSRMLSGVALLGSDMPAVTNLNDILALYGLGSYETIKNYSKNEKLTVKFYSFMDDKEVIVEKTAQEIKLEFELDAHKKQVEQIQKEAQDLKEIKEKLEKEAEEFKAFKVQIEKEKADALDAAEKAQREKYVSELLSEKLITPAMKEYVAELLVEKKEYVLKETKFTKQELFKEILKLHTAGIVNLKENSMVGQKDEENKDELEKKIEKYMKDNNCGYRQAAKAVTSEK